MILVVSHPADDHAAGVLEVLNRIGHPAVLVDTAGFPASASLTQSFQNGSRTFKYSANGRETDLSACGVAWWRRPQPFILAAGLAPGAASFTYTECHEAVAGLWAALDLTWVNPPHLDELAHHKSYQLAVARTVGLPIPRTVITNDPAVAREFINEIGVSRTIYKTFLASEQCWRETRIMRPQELEMLDRVSLAPVIFQEYVRASADLRVTVLGEEMFVAAVTPAPGGYQVDYRMDLDGASFTPTELSPKTKKSIRALMKRLGLVYGAIDLRRTDSEDVFLEINPAGEFRFVEERSGLPITQAMANLLARLDTKSGVT